MRRASISCIVFAVVLGFAAGAQGLQSSGQGSPAGTGVLKLASPASFSIEYQGPYKLVSVRRPWPGATEGFGYLLYERGSPPPPAALFPTARRIAIPLSRVISFSTSYIPSIVALGETDSLVGLDSADYVFDPEVRTRVASGRIAEVARNSVPDIERILALRPDALFTYGMGNEWDSHPKLLEAGLPVIIDGEWNETEPLARAEWSVFIAAFYGKETEAEARFLQVREAYLGLKAKAASATKRPKVLVNGPFQGSWYLSAGDSFMAHLLADAGADYLWADSRGTGALTLSVEKVYERALAAEIWLNPSLSAASLADVIALDGRFAALPAVRRGEVWNNNLRMSPTGGNDYFESAVIRPDEALADLIAIFHPELLPKHRFVWYRRLGK